MPKLDYFKLFVRLIYHVATMTASLPVSHSLCYILPKPNNIMCYSACTGVACCCTCILSSFCKY